MAEIGGFDTHKTTIRHEISAGVDRPSDATTEYAISIFAPQGQVWQIHDITAFQVKNDNNPQMEVVNPRLYRAVKVDSANFNSTHEATPTNAMPQGAFVGQSSLSNSDEQLKSNQNNNGDNSGVNFQFYTFDLFDQSDAVFPSQNEAATYRSKAMASPPLMSDNLGFILDFEWRDYRGNASNDKYTYWQGRAFYELQILYARLQ